jgi:hypothetical protein
VVDPIYLTAQDGAVPAWLDEHTVIVEFGTALADHEAGLGTKDALFGGHVWLNVWARWA